MKHIVKTKYEVDRIAEPKLVSFDAERMEFTVLTAGDIPAPAPVPEFVTQRQARRALLAAGMLDLADGLVAAMTGPDGTAANIDWYYADEIRRDNPLVVQLGAALGLSAGQLDQLFIQAKQIV